MADIPLSAALAFCIVIRSVSESREEPRVPEPAAPEASPGGPGGVQPAPAPPPGQEAEGPPPAGAPAGAPDADDGSDAAEPGAAAEPPQQEGLRKRRRRRRRGKDRGEERGGERGERPAGPPQPAAREREKGPRGRGRPARTSHMALSALRDLRGMAQALLQIEGVDPLSVPRHVDLHLRVPLDASADVRGAAAAAVEQILQRVREVREHERALRPGAVFCYFSGSAEVDHCRPAEPRQVFEGYNSTGRPVFSDFVTMAIERKDGGLDQLLAGEDVVLTHVTMGRLLRTQQLAEFGGNSPVFKILGQVDAGLFRVLGAEQKCAFSFQLLRGTTLEGQPRLRLHAVGKVDLMDLADPGLLNILSRFQRRLDEESLRLMGKERGGEVDDEAFVLPLLQDLAQKIAGRARSTGRRTRHAVARSEERQRPTPRAYPDAAEVGDGSILWDTEKSTIVVIGPKGRVHVFTPQARHVTSVMMQGSAIERRRQQGRWRPAEPEERGEFRIQLKRLVAAGEDRTVDEEEPAAAPQRPAILPAPAPAAVAPPAAREVGGGGGGGGPAPEGGGESREAGVEVDADAAGERSEAADESAADQSELRPGG